MERVTPIKRRSPCGCAWCLRHSLGSALRAFQPGQRRRNPLQRGPCMPGHPHASRRIGQKMRKRDCPALAGHIAGSGVRDAWLCAHRARCRGQQQLPSSERGRDEYFAHVPLVQQRPHRSRRTRRPPHLRAADELRQCDAKHQCYSTIGDLRQSLSHYRVRSRCVSCRPSAVRRTP